ncbi:MAG: glycosyltransferase [Alphaproteobacteria bacterium]|nr:glycosyltransferase [Alphaproteobacteria bacterium]
MKNNKPKVSVICMTYNHKNFIRQALDGFVMQKTKFPFEVIIHDDASTDGATDIIREYAEKYPDIIKPILQTENQWSRGISISQNYIWPNICGQYVAVCDGDDYWTDPYKLQKQVDFLDKHPDYSICFHPVVVFWDDNSQPETVYPRRNKELTLQELMFKGGITNCSVMYRWSDPTNQWSKNIYPGDWFLHLLHAKRGRIKFMPQVMARYRRQPTGISFSETSGADALSRRWGLHQVNFFNAVEKQIAPNNDQYHQYACRRVREIITAYAVNGEFDKVNQILSIYPDAKNVYPINDNTETKKWQKRFNRVLAVSIIIIATLIIAGVALL